MKCKARSLAPVPGVDQTLGAAGGTQSTFGVDGEYLDGRQRRERGLCLSDRRLAEDGRTDQVFIRGAAAGSAAEDESQRNQLSATKLSW